MSELFYSLSTEHATKRSIFGARCIVYKKILHILKIRRIAANNAIINYSNAFSNILQYKI